MKKLKYLILLFVLCLTCSFTSKQGYVATFNIDFKISLKELLKKETSEYSFSYGQKFILATGTVKNRDSYDELTVALTKDNQKTLTINNKEELNKINNPNEGWNIPSNIESYVIIPIDKLLIEGNTFQYLYEVTNEYLGFATEGYYDQYLDTIISQQYDNKIKIVAKHNESPFDNLKPVFTDYNGIFISNVNNPVTIEEVKSHIKAYDDVDGDITNKIKIDKDEYSNNEKVLGLHIVTFSVSDNANNTSYININIKVVDQDVPVINGPDELDSLLSNKLSIEDIVGRYSINDNFDKDIQLVYDDKYSQYMDTVGDYHIIFSGVDSSNNQVSKDVIIHVKDDIKPTISGNASYTTSRYKKIEVDEIIKGLRIEDIGDENINQRKVLIISNNYTYNYDDIGPHIIEFKVKDISNNISDLFTVTINVIDDSKPIFYIDEFIINCDPTTDLNNEYIMTLLGDCKTIDFSKIKDKDKQIVETYNDYKDNMEEGKYKISYKVSYDDGSVKDLNVIINKAVSKSIPLPWYKKLIFSCRYYYNFINLKISKFFDTIFNFIINIFR